MELKCCICKKGFHAEEFFWHPDGLVHKRCKEK